MTRFLGRSRVWIALLLVAALIVPVGRWLVDELAFSASGDAVADELGADAELTEAMLLVRSVGCSGRVSTGSAFVLDLDGVPTVVTNRHVVEAARSSTVRPLSGGASTVVEGYRTSASADVAILELGDEVELPPALAQGGAVQPDTEVRVIGFPAGRPSTGTGTVLEAATDRLLIDAPVSGGASGSPVLDAAGRVVGQVFATTATGEGVATPVDHLVRALSAATSQAPDC